MAPETPNISISPKPLKRKHPLAADITPGSVAALDLAPGMRVLFTVKAAEVMIYPA